MARGRNLQAWIRPLLGMGAALCLVPGAPALAQSAQAAAGGGATIVQPVGAGVAYDVATQVLTSIFLMGQTGEQLSVLLPGRRVRNRGFDPGYQAYSAPGNVVVLSTGMVSIDVESVEAASQRTGRGNGGDTMLVLAQFN